MDQQISIFIGNPEPEKTENENRRPRRVVFMRNIYIGLHYGFLCLYFILPNSFFYDSFHNIKPYIFCLTMVMLTLFMRYYALSCQGAGYQTTEPPNPEGLFFSKDAGIHCPVRSCYCRICKKVVLRRDHHCPWTGHCIGRDNNVYFLMFTLIESIILSLITLDGIRSMYLNWVQGYGFIMFLFNVIFLCATCFAAGFTSMMTMQTLQTVSKNLTIWEAKCHNKITYLRDYPEWVSPFDKGMIQNFKEFFTMRKNKTVWEIPKKPNLSAFTIPSDVWRNFDQIQESMSRHKH